MKNIFKNKIFKLSLTILIIVLTINIIPCMSVLGENATSYTYTISENGKWVATQDAYLVSKVLMREQSLKNPQDLFIKDNFLYIADTGNSRIIVYDINLGKYSIIGDKILSSPTGIYVNDSYEIYVADSGLKAVVKFSSSGELLKKYGRPNDLTFGSKSSYSPSKVVVNNNGIIYIVSDGSYDGIIQLNEEGKFLGYFGYNNSDFNAVDFLKNTFLSEKIKSQFFNKIPYSFNNIDIDKKGIVYTVTQNAKGNALKKHDVSGKNIFQSNMVDESDFCDVSVCSNGQVFAVTKSGLIFEYDTNGQLLFSFGGHAIAVEKSGVFSNVAAIETDSNENIYVLDGERGLVHVFEPTNYASSVHKAIKDFDLGKYNSSYNLWSGIASVCGGSRFCINSMAQCLFQKKNYNDAAKLYKESGDKNGYSQAFWHIRSLWISKTLPFLIVGLIILVLLLKLIKSKLKNNKNLAFKQRKIYKDTKLLFFTIRHPIDSFYDIRHEQAGNIFSSIILYIIAYIEYIAFETISGFVLIENNNKNVSILFLTIIFFSSLLLFIFSNFLVGEVMDSNSRLSDIFISTSYILSPFIVLSPFIILISHIITISELRLLQLVIVAMIIWMIVLLIIATREIHAFTTWISIRHLLIIAFLMCVIVITVSIVYMFWDQIFDFIISVIKEAGYRAK